MLYPPILASTQSVFSIDEMRDGYEVKFSLASITSEEDIKHVGILVVKYNNNKSIVNTSRYPDGIIYKPYTGTSVIIAPDDLGNPKWEAGNLYKIQLRFGSSNLPSSWSASNFADWHRTQVEQNAFSEWSTAMIVKPINPPSLQIVKDNSVYTGGSSTRVNLISSLVPSFFGVCTIKKSDKEVETSYKFDLLQDNTLLESSGWLQHSVGQDDAVHFKTLLENQQVYQVTYTIRTNNGYEATTKPFNFIAMESYLGNLTNLSIQALEDVQNARILITLESTNMEQVTGNFLITRTSEKSNFQVWEEIKYLNYFLENFSPAKICFIDYTIESGITYQYAIQSLNAKKIRSNPLKTQKVMINLEYSYLVRDNIQLRLTFNQKMSNFKHVTLRSKQDTLGDKYPHLFQNGNAYYAEFPVSGLITYKGNETETLSGRWGQGTDSTISGRRVIDINYPYPDNLNTSPAFFYPGASGVYYNGELVIKTEKFEQKNATRPQAAAGSGSTVNPDDYRYFDHWQSYPSASLDTNTGEYVNQFYPNEEDVDRFEDKYYEDHPEQEKPTRDPITLPSGEYSEGIINYTISTDMTDNNIFIERKFREKVEEFLNDFSCKLYRSPTEGNIIINLMDVSMSPNEQLGRMVYEFSATAYEVLDNSLSEMDKYGIINIGDMDLQVEEDEIFQNFGQVDFWPGQEGGKTIYQKIKAREEVVFNEIYRFKVQNIKDLWIEPYPKERIQYLISQTKVKDGETKVPQYLINFLRASEASPIKVRINNTKDIYISPFKIYTFKDEEVKALSLVSAKFPILINYGVNLSLKIDSTIQVVDADEDLSKFGQVAGLFSENEDILSQYNLDYGNSTTLKIAEEGYYGIYNTKNLVAAIKETVKQELQSEGKDLTDQQDGSWKDAFGNLYYFKGIDSVDIEADTGTIFHIGESSSNYQTYEIGKNRSIGAQEGTLIRFQSNRIFFKQVYGHANYFCFENSTVAIVNYTYILEIRTISSIEE